MILTIDVCLLEQAILGSERCKWNPRREGGWKVDGDEGK